MFIPWDINHKCPVRTWDDLQLAYEYSSHLSINPEIACGRIRTNILKRKYIQRLSSNLRDSENVANVVRKYCTQLADNLNHLKPMNPKRKPLNLPTENVIRKNEEQIFLQKLAAYKESPVSVLHEKTSKMMGDIKHVVKTKRKLISRIINAKEKGTKITMKNYLKKHRYLHWSDPQTWKITNEEILLTYSKVNF